ncbi:MAG: type II secretion system protein [Campylobacterota bacterium]|nr:type II secretion system protein [Campylobacterota bacterium]
MKRSGFTMIELIFVIVILGILAAVAIPKLAATRDDAKIAKGATEVATAVSDFGAYYTAQGTYGVVTDMSNVVFDDPESDFNATEQAFYQVNGENCIEFNTTDDAAEDGNFSVSHVVANTTAVCEGIANAAKKVTGGVGSNQLHSFGGSNVNWD